ncbi:MAG: hypothetical protein QNK82_01410 [Akkermansiaceae bacterium]
MKPPLDRSGGGEKGGYVRNSFGNNSSPIRPDEVKKVREEIKGKQGLYSPDELLKAHPMR